MLQDLPRALSLVRARAADWNIDPVRLGVMGFSAGGNLAGDLNSMAKIPPTLIIHIDDEKSFVTGSKLHHAALDAARVMNSSSILPAATATAYTAWEMRVCGRRTH